MGFKSKKKTPPVQVGRETFRTRKIFVNLGLDGFRFDYLLEVLRDSVTHKVIDGFRITFPKMDNPSQYRFMDIDMKSGRGGGITLRVICDSVYLVAIEKHSNRGVWYCLRESLAEQMEGAVYVGGIGENYNDLGDLYKVQIGLVAIQAAIDSIDKSDIRSEVNKKHIKNLIVNIIESARFRKLGVKVSELVNSYENSTLPSEWPDKIRDWGTAGFNIIQEKKIKNLGNFEEVHGGENWYRDIRNAGTENVGGLGFELVENPIVLVAGSEAQNAVNKCIEDEEDEKSTRARTEVGEPSDKKID